jgi:hypothetical protein
MAESINPVGILRVGDKITLYVKEPVMSEGRQTLTIEQAKRFRAALTQAIADAESVRRSGVATDGKIRPAGWFNVTIDGDVSSSVSA